MPAKNIFGQDREAMIDAIFAEQDQKLVEQMRQRAREKATKEALAETSGITDETLLDKLIELEINPGTFRALALIPLIEVAWADNRMEPEEREAILRAANESGIVTGSEGYQLLENWLNTRPPESLLETWMRYTSSIASTLDEKQKQELKDELLGKARDVAAAAGGFLGLTSKISAVEQTMLDRLAEVF
jgi:hypothetical protein